MIEGNNDIVIVNGCKTPNYNDIDNGSRYSKARDVEIIADKLVDKLGLGQSSRPFMCKAAYRLSEARLWAHCEQALSGNNPAGLFIWLCKRDGV